ncbi:hypothetical protein Acr_27g0003700 [Actinidia rufa]|uniref:Uncharacterized protein n=1 Tax=Actinidia rufa TaxID=165716 RepID=A0A7J0H6H4_9ERIC|nr:hypothetical protein Acr_27g0003700 [Actinidia rufa]
MVITSCIGGCLDSQSPAEKRHVRMRQWEESDKQFLRVLSMNKEEREIKNWLKETKNLESRTRDDEKKAQCSFVDSVFKSLFACVGRIG